MTRSPFPYAGPSDHAAEQFDDEAPTSPNVLPLLFDPTDPCDDLEDTEEYEYVHQDN